MKKYSLGVAFSGGGAKAGAHCGALQALKEFGIKPEIVSGTSAGARAATMYAAGISPVKMIELFSGMSFFKDIVKPGIPGGGFFDSKPLVQHLRRHIPYSRLEDLPIPTYVTASDLEHGRLKVFSKGDLAPRVVASCSIPVVFKPMVIGGIHYVDGGAFQNLPVPAIRSRCEKVIALNLNHIHHEKYKPVVPYVAMRSFMMMFVSNSVADSRLADLTIDLDTAGSSVYDMTKLKELFFRGYDSAVKALEAAGYERQFPREDVKL